MRRAFADKVNRGLEKCLRLKHPEREPKPEVTVDELKRMSLPPTPNELLNQEREEFDQKVLEKLLIVQHILQTLPVVAKRRVMNNLVANKIRELLQDIRVEQIPDKMLQWLNDLDLL